MVNVVCRVGRCAIFQPSLLNVENKSLLRTYSRDNNVDHHQHIVGKRFSSNGDGGGMSGQLSFYKEVNIDPVAVPPLEKMGGVVGRKTNTVNSPFSAGVDDMQSASGVSLSMLDPS